MTLVTSPPITAYVLEPFQFFDARLEGLRHIATGEEMHLHRGNVAGMRSSIVRFVRTPDGAGLGVLKTDGSVQTWSISGSVKGEVRCSLDAGDVSIDQVVVLAQG